jgi:hypothetical protein
MAQRILTQDETQIINAVQKREVLHFWEKKWTKVCSPEEFFEWFCDFCHEPEHWNRDIQFRNDEEQFDAYFHCERDDLKPQKKEGCLAHYLNRISMLIENPGILVRHFQTVNHTLYGRLAGLTRLVADRIGLPIQGVKVDVFISKSQKGFFALHKDQIDVFTFCIQGQKHFQLWPFDALADELNANHHSPMNGVVPSHYSEEILEKAPCEIRLHAGEILFWPAEYWHHIRSDGGPCVTLSPGFFFAYNPEFLQKNIPGYLPDKGRVPFQKPIFLKQMSGCQDRQDSELLYNLDLLQSHRTSSSTTLRLKRQLIQLASGCGFHRQPDPIAEVKRFQRTTVFQRKPESHLVWFQQDQDSICVGMNGYLLEWPNRGATLEFLAQLNSKQTFEIQFNESQAWLHEAIATSLSMNFMTLA